VGVSKTQNRYRPEIDGLRAVAVLSVVFYHAHFNGFSGGYLGVDVFFVISGFLITNIILRSDGNFISFGEFYERRIRRIFPALASVLLAIAATSLWLFSPWEVWQYSKSFIYSTVFVINLQAMLGSGYFANVISDDPLAHLWSLAVEEQFYLLYPLFLWGLRRFQFKIIPALVVVTLTSFVISIALGLANPTYNFYFTGARGWELLLGALVAVLPFDSRFLTRRPVAEGLSCAALGMIIASVALFDDHTVWPSYRAALPCLGAALLLGLNRARLTISGTVLGWKPLVHVGLISYSLYLWHWPLFVFARHYVLRPITGGEYLALILVSFALAYLSWRYVEQPFRKRMRASRQTIFCVTAVTLALFVAGAATARVMEGFPARISPAAQLADRNMNSRLETDYQDRFHYGTCFIFDKQNRYRFDLCFSPSKGRPNVLLWGDSHAMHLIPGFEAEAQKQGVKLLEASGCPPILDPKYVNAECLKANSAFFSRVNNDLSAVVLSARFFFLRQNLQAFRHTVRQIVQRGVPVVVIGPSPEFLFREPLFVERYLETVDASMIDSDKRMIPGLGEFDEEMRKLFEHEPGVTYVSFYKTICRQGRCPMMINNAPTFADMTHLSIDGSMAFGPALWAPISAVVAQSWRNRNAGKLDKGAQ
jgi:peptidoglycan/LPS O-acetylase OafA/YrhL